MNTSFINYIIHLYQDIKEAIVATTKYQWKVFGSFVLLILLNFIAFYLLYSFPLGLMIVFFSSLVFAIISYFFVFNALLDHKKAKLDHVKILLDKNSTKKEILFAQIIRFCMREIESTDSFNPFDLSEKGLRNRKYNRVIDRLNTLDIDKKLEIFKTIELIPNDINGDEFIAQLKEKVDAIDDKSNSDDEFFYIPKAYLYECFSHGKWLLVGAIIFLMFIPPILMAGLTSFDFFDFASNSPLPSWSLWWSFFWLDSIDIMQKLLTDFIVPVTSESCNQWVDASLSGCFAFDRESCVNVLRCTGEIQDKAGFSVHFIGLLLSLLILGKIFNALNNIFDLRDETKNLVEELKYATEVATAAAAFGGPVGSFIDLLETQKMRLNLLLILFPEQIYLFKGIMNDDLTKNRIFISNVVAALQNNDRYILSERFDLIHDDLEIILHHLYAIIDSDQNNQLIFTSLINSLSGLINSIAAINHLSETQIRKIEKLEQLRDKIII